MLMIMIMVLRYREITPEKTWRPVASSTMPK
jgi:hypothetical protein